MSFLEMLLVILKHPLTHQVAGHLLRVGNEALIRHLTHRARQARAAA